MCNYSGCAVWPSDCTIAFVNLFGILYLYVFAVVVVLLLGFDLLSGQRVRVGRTLAIDSVTSLVLPSEMLGIAYGIMLSLLNACITVGPIIVGLIHDSTEEYVLKKRHETRG
ncbi:MAG: hypothetical protein P4M11_03860 [Candidatus Pacebacteria bacterium]|nr:hypothetical protein [Candidatus Paceibacterota bacterium]